MNQEKREKLYRSAIGYLTYLCGEMEKLADDVPSSSVHHLIGILEALANEASLLEYQRAGELTKDCDDPKECAAILIDAGVSPVKVGYHLNISPSTARMWAARQRTPEQFGGMSVRAQNIIRYVLPTAEITKENIAANLDEILSYKGCGKKVRDEINAYLSAE